MKIAFIVRATLFTDKGGDTIQVLNTAKYLERLGIKVDIKLTTERIDYIAYDLFHFINIIRPADILSHIGKTEKPFVVSTVFVEYAEFEQHHRKGFPGFLFSFLSPDAIEYIKVMGRFFSSGEKIAGKRYLLNGHRNSVREIIRKSAWLLPNSENEYRRLVEKYQIDKNYSVIPYAVDEEVFKPVDVSIKNKEMVICVGRIEGRKNQLNLIKALCGTRFELYLVGNPAPHQMCYFEGCKKISAPNVHFVSELSQEELIPYYREAKVHVLPSWFETAGLSSLEAAAMGCNVVITRKGDAWEYFGDQALYCDPASPESIYDAVEKASLASQNSFLQQRIYSDFTWRKAASKTFEAYKEVLKLCE
jgi:glycosyltransferase involved in cell wall biosynthesis